MRRAARAVAVGVLSGGMRVVTGGDGTDGPGVKDQVRAAVAGRGRWAGVAYDGPTGRPCATTSRDGLLLRPRIGHQRNLLIASLCDAAVVLEGGLGTTSECLAALGLGRPVLLVGSHWDGPVPDLLPRLVRGDPVADDEWHRAADAVRTLLRDPPGPLDASVVTAVRDVPPVAPPGSVQVVTGQGTPDRVRGWLAGQTSPRWRPGGFPDAPGLEDLAEVWRAWVGR